MFHEPRLTAALRELLAGHRVASLGTLGEDGAAFVSMVPFAVDADHRCVVIHVSGLAAHTRNLQRTPHASLMVCAAEAAGEPVHALARVTLDVQAHEVAEDEIPACRAVYLARFPEAEPMTALGDFRFVRLVPQSARQVAGFGAARSIEATELLQALGAAP